MQGLAIRSASGSKFQGRAYLSGLKVRQGVGCRYHDLGIGCLCLDLGFLFFIVYRVARTYGCFGVPVPNKMT